MATCKVVSRVLPVQYRYDTHQTPILRHGCTKVARSACALSCPWFPGAHFDSHTKEQVESQPASSTPIDRSPWTSRTSPPPRRMSSSCAYVMCTCGAAMLRAYVAKRYLLSCAQVRSEVQQQALQELTQNLQEKCFDKCLTRPSGKLDSKQQNCLALCINRYIDTMKAVSEAMVQRGPQVRALDMSFRFCRRSWLLLASNGGFLIWLCVCMCVLVCESRAKLLLERTIISAALDSDRSSR